MHPLVMFSILETWNHRPEESTDVIGILLGTKTNGTITLHEAHYIQHTLTREPELELQCDLQRVRAITTMARSINPDYAVIGWFTTYTQIDNVHRIIQNHFSQEFDEPDLCLLTVDTTLSDNSLSPTLYTHNNVQVGSAQAATETTTTTTTALPPPAVQLTLFSKAQLNTIIPTQEALALHSFLTAQTGESEEIAAPLALLSNAQVINNFINGDLVTSIALALDYVSKAASGEIQGDVNIGKKLAYICSNIPSFDPETVDSMLTDSINDLSMFSGLAQITKATIKNATFTPTGQ